MVKTSKINDQLTQICVENVKLGMSNSACAKAVGVTYETWNNWVKWGKEGKAPYSKWYIEIQAAEADLMKQCLQQIRAQADHGSLTATMFLLERKFPQDFGKSSSVNVSAVTENVNVNVKSKSEELAKIREDILSKLARPAYPPAYEPKN